MFWLYTSSKLSRNSLNFHWRLRWWDQIQPTFWNLLYFKTNLYVIYFFFPNPLDQSCSLFKLPCFHMFLIWKLFVTNDEKKKLPCGSHHIPNSRSKKRTSIPLCTGELAFSDACVSIIMLSNEKLKGAGFKKKTLGGVLYLVFSS